MVKPKIYFIDFQWLRFMRSFKCINKIASILIFSHICISSFLKVSFVFSIHLAFLLYDFLWFHILLQDVFKCSIIGGYLLHLLSHFLFFHRILLGHLEIFCCLKNFFLVFHIFRYARPLVGFSASIFLLLSGSYQQIFFIFSFNFSSFTLTPLLI